MLQGLEQGHPVPAHRGLVQHQRRVAAALGLGEAELDAPPVLEGLLQALQLGELRAAAPGDLGVLAGDVAADVVLLPLDVLLLALEMALGDLDLRFLLLDELGVVALVGAAAAQLDLQDAGGDAVQEVAVVADDGHGGGCRVDEALQPAQAGQVQVVGGLVQQQEVLALEDGLGQHHAALLAAAEFQDALVHHLGREAQGEEDGFGAAADGESVLALEGLLHLLVPLHDGVQVHPGLGHGVLQVAHLMLQGLHVAEGGHGLFQDGSAGGRRQVLGIVAHADAALGGGPHHGALIQLQLAQQDLEDRALAGAVASDDAPALVLLDGPGDVLQHLVGAEAEEGVVQAGEHVRVSRKEATGLVASVLVELSGIEPLTSCMPCKRSPS